MALQRKPGRPDDHGRVSSIYARIGPSDSAAYRAAGCNARLGRRIRADWEAWRAEYGDAWDEGLAGTPPPPHHDTAGAGYA
jgi:hypothetical protein